MPPSAERLFALLSPSVLAVESFDRGGNQVVSRGSGVVTTAGYVVTNKHVVEKGVIIRVKSGSQNCLAKVTHQHPNHDLCQLGVEGLKAPPVSIQDSSNVVIGERVYAIGSPFGFDLTISEGLVSGLRMHNGESVIQTTAPISEGSSGGGLFDSYGKLVGITTYYIKGGQNLNFALPARLVSTLVRYSATQHPMATQVETAAATLGPAAMVKARLEMGFPQANFEVHADGEQVIHVVWHGPPSEVQVRDYLRSLILRRELPNPEFDFEWCEQ